MTCLVCGVALAERRGPGRPRKICRAHGCELARAARTRQAAACERLAVAARARGDEPAAGRLAREAACLRGPCERDRPPADDELIEALADLVVDVDELESFGWEARDE